MNNKKIILSFLLVVLIALSVSSVSAENATDDVVAADDSVDELSADPIQPTNNTVDSVQTAVDSANKTGDIVDLSKYEEYDFGAKGVTIQNSNIIVDGKGTTTIKGDGAGSGLIQVTGTNVTIQGIKFIDTNAKNNFTYGGSVNGVGVRFNGANNGILKNCEFTDFNSAVQVMGTTGLLVEDNEFKGGYTTLIANDPTVNVETGSKSLNIYRQSSQVTIRGNTFDGPILDAISIAQGSGSNIVENNVFLGNTYSIYFGGSSTKNTVVRNNTFKNCGKFNDGEVQWIRLPVISIQKASNDIAFENNTFYAVENSVLIAAEQGNEAHGFPSSLGNINVTGSTVYTDGLASPKDVVLFHVLVREGELNLSAPIKLENNVLNGATENVTWLLDNGTEYTTPDNNNAEKLQVVIDSAKPGDVIDLTVFDSYDFADSGITIATNNITLKGNGNTIIKGHGAGNGLVYITASNVTVEGIVFVDTNPANNFVYGGSTNGWGVNFRGATGGLVKDCEFEDFNSAVVIQASFDILVENNYFYGGYTTLIANDPTVNVEKGSKSLNIYRQSARITVRGNTFEGPILDAISIAQGSGSNIVENNRFLDNTYSIYFGGSSTKNTVVRNNTFINCGEFKKDGQFWERLPVISIQKASNDIAFENNTFLAVENSVLIAAEQGNEAHGFPSSLGNINVTGSIVYTEGLASPKDVVLFHVLVREGKLNLSAPIKLQNNTLNGATENVTWLLEDGNEYPLTPTTNTSEAIQKAIDDANAGDVIDLSNFEKYDLGNETLTISNDVTLKGNGSTVVNGSIQVKGNTKVTIDGISGITVYTTEPVATTMASSDVTVTAGDSGNLQVTLKDADGKAVAGKTISVMVNGESSQITTDANGTATFAFKYDAANTYYVSFSFLGDDEYKASFANAKITVNAKPVPPVVKKATKITAKKATLKVKKVKKIKVTLKSGSKALSGKTITIKVNKKTSKAKTNKKGVATIKVKITKKGKFTATVKFAGDNTYKAVTKKVKYTVKK